MTRTTSVAGRLSLRLALSSALLFLGAPLLFAQHTDPASNAGLQNLTFAAHANTVFTGPTGLAHASRVLQRCDAISAPDQDVACNITLAQEGEIGTFGTAGDGLDVITTADELDAALNDAAAYVKVVTSIEFCDGVPGMFTGCAKTPGTSIVIVAGLDETTTGEVIAQLFGHNKGLPGRTTPGNPLMNPAGGGDEVNQAECAAFHVGLTDNGPNVQQDFPPEITCPADVVIECSATGGTPKADPQVATFFSSVVADDGCEAAPTITNDAPDLFPVGVSTVVTFSATDSTGNNATCTASVTVNDTTPPVATCPADAQVECSATGGTPKTDPQLATFFAGASAVDICDPAPVLTNDAPDLFPLGSTDVTFSATDGRVTSARAGPPSTSPIRRLRRYPWRSTGTLYGRPTTSSSRSLPRSVSPTSATPIPPSLCSPSRATRRMTGTGTGIRHPTSSPAKGLRTLSSSFALSARGEETAAPTRSSTRAPTCPGIHRTPRRASPCRTINRDMETCARGRWRRRRNSSGITRDAVRATRRST